MSEPTIDEMTHEQLIDLALNQRLAINGNEALIKSLREQSESRKDQQIADYAAANRAVGAIYKMVELIKDTPVTHAQREGQFLLLLAFISKRWPSHSAKFSSSDDYSDIPF